MLIFCLDSLSSCFDPIIHSLPSSHRHISSIIRFLHIESFNHLLLHLDPAFSLQHPILSLHSTHHNLQIQLMIEQHTFELHKSTCTWIFFNNFSCSPYPRFCICGFSQPWIESSIFNPWVGSSHMQRTNCMHSCRPFYIRDLSIHGFWCQWRVLEPMPHGYLGMTIQFLCVCLVSAYRMYVR